MFLVSLLLLLRKKMLKPLFDVAVLSLSLLNALNNDVDNVSFIAADVCF